MEPYLIRLIESIILVVVYLVLRAISFRIINKTMSKRFIQKSRGEVIRRVVSVTLLLIFLTFIFLIWGVNQADLAIFIGSVLTVVGVAFFAQWSILSNITSSIIIFFNHPIKLEDSVTILEGKDYVLEGKVVHIGLFFITLETAEQEEVTLPNNVFIMKSVKKMSHTSLKEANKEANSETPTEPTDSPS